MGGKRGKRAVRAPRPVPVPFPDNTPPVINTKWAPSSRSNGDRPPVFQDRSTSRSPSCPSRHNVVKAVLDTYDQGPKERARAKSASAPVVRRRDLGTSPTSSPAPPVRAEPPPKLQATPRYMMPKRSSPPPPKRETRSPSPRPTWCYSTRTREVFEPIRASPPNTSKPKEDTVQKPSRSHSPTWRYHNRPVEVFNYVTSLDPSRSEKKASTRTLSPSAPWRYNVKPPPLFDSQPLTSWSDGKAQPGPTK
eukprot:Sspe_Gene.12059::Locus_4105_Transcript_1_1_Confidence_1.000_Length_845::g.12059::m.12059